MAKVVPERWQYSRAGDLYDVSPGDIWKVGEHTVGCGDIEKMEGEKFVQAIGHKTQLLYYDPPWGQSAASSYRTKAGETTGLMWGGFVVRLLEFVKYAADGPVYSEMGFRELKAYQKQIESLGGVVVETFATTYYRKHKSYVVAFSFKKAFTPVGLNGYDDGETPHIVALGHAQQGYSEIMDVCCGRGLTAEAAVQAGLVFYGFELHPRRLADTLQKLRELTGEVPTLAGRFI